MLLSIFEMEMVSPLPNVIPSNPEYGIEFVRWLN